MIQLSHKTEKLARQIALTRGVSLEEAVKLAIEESSKQVARPAFATKLTREELIRRMEEISARCGARPLVDPRSPDELIGYDDFGLPG